MVFRSCSVFDTKLSRHNSNEKLIEQLAMISHAAFVFIQKPGDMHPD